MVRGPAIAAQLVGVLLASSATFALLASCSSVAPLTRYQTRQPPPADLDKLADDKIDVQDLKELRGGIMTNGLDLTFGVVMNTIEGNHEVTSTLNLNNAGQLVAVASQLQVLPPSAPQVTAPTAPTAPNVVAPTAPTVVAPTSPTVIAPVLSNAASSGGTSQVVTALTFTPPGTSVTTNPAGTVAPTALAGTSGSAGTGLSLTGNQLANAAQLAAVTAGPSAPSSSAATSGAAVTIASAVAPLTQLASLTTPPATVPSTPVSAGAVVTAAAAPSMAATSGAVVTPAATQSSPLTQLASLTSLPAAITSAATAGGTVVTPAATQSSAPVQLASLTTSPAALPSTTVPSPIASAVQLAGTGGGTSAPVSTPAAAIQPASFTVALGNQTVTQPVSNSTFATGNSAGQGSASASSPVEGSNFTVTGLGTSNFSAVLGNPNTTQVTQQLTGNSIATIVANRVNGINVTQTTTLNVTVGNLAQFTNQMAARTFLNQIAFTMSGIKGR